MVFNRDFSEELSKWAAVSTFAVAVIAGYLESLSQRDVIQEHMDAAFREKHKRLFDIADEIEKERLERLNGKDDSNPT